jgi:4-amino-4-deoxy-L-arabinose transferase-like glycosyltransferase
MNAAALKTREVAGPASWLERASEAQLALLVIGCGLLLYLPLAGSYGLWDPWETHYSEVARQMTSRGDYISLWWPGSWRETPVFQTKPVLSFWLMSLAMHVAGVGGGDAGEMALGHRAEWAVRTPFCVLAALGLYGVYLLTARLAGRRAGLLAALVTATCPMYALVARQAMTDMAFVAPITLALAFGALAIHGDGATEDPLPRRQLGRLSWPHDPVFYGALALFVVCAVPQLLVDSIDLRVPIPWAGRRLTMYGVVAMLPYWAGFVAVVLLAARARQRAPLYLYLAASLCGLAVLGKGLAGLALPVVLFAAYLVVTGHWRELGRRRLVVPLLVSLLAAAVVAVPWHHAMIIRHGSAWWNELFGDNHWRRLMIGRWGDRGTFEYFLRELGYGVLPWVALAPAALAAAVMGGAGGARRRAALAFGAIWFAGAYALVSLSMTKFHHYVLPAIPGLGIVVGCMLDGWLATRRPRAAIAVALAGTPLLVIIFADLLATQNAAQRFLWLFSYDYIYNPRGRTWPDALDFRPALGIFAALFAAAAVACAFGRLRRWAVAMLGVTAVLFTLFLLDGFMPRVAPYWSQKETIAAYYRLRRSPEERLIAYRLFWRGETFYTKNAIYDGPSEERTMFDSDDASADDALRNWLARHRGRRHYFLFEASRRGTVESLLPADARGSFRLVDQPNNKFSLGTADL